MSATHDLFPLQRLFDLYDRFRRVLAQDPSKQERSTQPAWLLMSWALRRDSRSARIGKQIRYRISKLAEAEQSGNAKALQVAYEELFVFCRRSGLDLTAMLAANTPSSPNPRGEASQHGRTA